MTTEKQAQVTEELDKMQQLFYDLRSMGETKIQLREVIRYIELMRQDLEL